MLLSNNLTIETTHLNNLEVEARNVEYKGTKTFLARFDKKFLENFSMGYITLRKSLLAKFSIPGSPGSPISYL